MILGLDISTSCTGVTILDYTGTVVLNTCWKFKEDDSFDKLDAAKKYIRELKNKYPKAQWFTNEDNSILMADLEFLDPPKEGKSFCK